MDALMIVHQLQRLAAEPRPSPAVRAKIPRMAVGICYFLEHPDPGVQHQAAGALRLMLKQHQQLFLRATELQELRSALQRHANSSDVVVSECCAASLALLHQQEGSTEEKLRQPQQPSEAESSVETLESLDLFSVVLGLRGLLRCPSNRSLLTFKHQQPQAQHLGGEQRQGSEGQEERQRMLELLQRDLQLRLVRVWGVSSATVTLNAARLLQQVASMDGDKAASASAAALEQNQLQPNEEGDGVAVVCIRLSRRAQRLQQQLRELRAAIGPLTLLLDSELLQKAPSSPHDTSCPNDASRSTSNDSRAPAPAAQQQQRQGQQQQQREQQDDGYLDEELKESWGRAAENGGKTAETLSDGSSNGGFSFFSANSALFAQSRFMGGMIAPVESNAEMSTRLKTEKERKAALRSSQGGLIDKLLSRLGSGAGLL